METQASPLLASGGAFLPEKEYDEFYRIVPEDEEILTTALEEFDFQNPAIDPEKIATVLAKIIQASPQMALGISANQIGLPHRVFVMRADPFWACFNPRIVDQSAEQIVLDEGCLSFPNLYVKVKRPARIRARFQDINGAFHTEVLGGMSARVYQHELDHLNGISFIKRANPIHLDRARRLKKRLDRQKKNLK